MGMTETWPEIKRRQQEERCAAVTDAIAACGGNQAEAAKLLQMARGSLDRMVREYGLVAPKPAK
jgi:DNA-binding NtrC family response regulator